MLDVNTNNGFFCTGVRMRIKREGTSQSTALLSAETVGVDSKCELTAV